MTAVVESPTIVIERIERLSPERKALWDTADYIEQRGHMRGHVGRDGGPRCVRGALMSVTGLGNTFVDSDSDKTYCQAHDLLIRRVGFVPVWSDTTDTETVIKTLREIALGFPDKKSAEREFIPTPEPMVFPKPEKVETGEKPLPDRKREVVESPDREREREPVPA